MAGVMLHFINGGQNSVVLLCIFWIELIFLSSSVMCYKGMGKLWGQGFMFKLFVFLFFMAICTITRSVYAGDAVSTPDRVLQAKIWMEIKSTFPEMADVIKIKVVKGQVSLAGYSETGAQKYVAGMIVKKYPSVKGMDNNIIIKD